MQIAYGTLVDVQLPKEDGVLTAGFAGQMPGSKRVSTGIVWLDPLFGGGLVRGSFTMISGEPGSGKSTLLAQVCHMFKNSLYVSAEESQMQVGQRVLRLGLRKDMRLMYNGDIDNILEVAKGLKVELLIIDSLQTLESSKRKMDTAAFAREIRKFCKSTNTIVIMVVQMNKQGNYAGSKKVEHEVDTVARLAKDPGLLYLTKNRNGSIDTQIPVHLTNKGLIPLPQSQQEILPPPQQQQQQKYYRNPSPNRPYRKRFNGQFLYTRRRAYFNQGQEGRATNSLLLPHGKSRMPKWKQALIVFFTIYSAILIFGAGIPILRQQSTSGAPIYGVKR